jgi:hypothetical protein
LERLIILTKSSIDFYLFGFDVDFGASPEAPKPLDIYQFFLILHKPGPDSSTDPSHQHESPLLTYIKVESSVDDSNLSSSSSALKHQPRLLIDALGSAAFKYILEAGNFPMASDTTTKTTTGDPASTGAGTKWFVKGGTFQFRISTDYAINDAILTTSNPTAPRHFDGFHPSKNLQPIASKPMYLTSDLALRTTSTLTIRIQRIITLHPLVLDSIPISNWASFTFTSKPLPTAIWGSYDESQDPSKNQRPSTLLDGANSTIRQNVGAALTAPPPFLCPKPDWPGFIPKFRATAAARFGILDFRVNLKGDEWFVPSGNPMQVNYLPRALTTQEKSHTKQERWKGLATTWTSLSSKSNMVNDKATGLLALAAKTLQWDQKRPQLSNDEAEMEAVREKETGLKAWDLVGGVPGKMVKNLKSVYLDLPRLGVVGA